MNIRWFFLGLSIAMIVLVIITSMQSNMFNLPAVVVNEPWFRTTLIDFYFNIAIISAWVIYKENHVGRSLGWILAFIVLGSIATSFYVFLQLSQIARGKSLEDVLCRR